jgi:hypothetical protein
LADKSGLGRHHRAEAKGEHGPSDGSERELEPFRQTVQRDVKQQSSSDHPDKRRLPLDLESAGVDVGIYGAGNSRQSDHGQERVAEGLRIAVVESQIVLLRASVIYSGSRKRSQKQHLRGWRVGGRGGVEWESLHQKKVQDGVAAAIREAGGERGDDDGGCAIFEGQVLFSRVQSIFAESLAVAIIATWQQTLRQITFRNLFHFCAQRQERRSAC